jgi:hypothetical protein
MSIWARSGSIARSDDPAGRFEATSSAYIARLEDGDGFGVSARGKPAALAGLIAKRALNRAFAAAAAKDLTLNFQAFAAARAAEQ